MKGCGYKSVKKSKLQFTILLVIMMLLGSNLPVYAEGSKELTSNGGYRPYLEWDPGNSSAGIPRKNILKVYAKAGETINLGTSVYSAQDNKEIILRSPSGIETSFDVVQNGSGHIASIGMEKAGPSPNKGGYTPKSITVQQEGIWEVEFHSPAVTNVNPKALATSEQFPTSNEQGKAVAAWDITVRNLQGVDQTGRVFADYLALNMGSNSIALNSILYVLTKDGYKYKTSLNGMDPFGFIFFSNNRGFIDQTNNSTLYHSITSAEKTNAMPLSGNVKVQSPFAADDEWNLTHRVFINEPSSSLPASIPTNAISPSKPEDLGFLGKNNNTNVAFEGDGGTFTFKTNRVGSYQLIIDTAGANGKPDGNFSLANDVVIENVSVIGTNTVVWNGKDRNGIVLPALADSKPYNVKVILKGGEYHFPLLDVENNPNGFIIELLNKPFAYPNGIEATTVFYNDESYNTANGTQVNLTGIANPNATGGVDSANGAHKYISNYGDYKGIDTWTYFPGESVTTQLYITKSKVTGKVFNDTNKNGVLDTSEAGLPNIFVDIKNSLGMAQTVTTDSNGNYSTPVLTGSVEIKVADHNPSLDRYYLSTNNKEQLKQVSNGVNLLMDPIGYKLNAAPTADLAQSKEITQPNTAAGTVHANDVDGDKLVYTINPGEIHGQANVDQNGNWTYDPEDNYHGTVEFEILIADGKGGETTSKITVVVNPKPNVAPTVNSQLATVIQPEEVSGMVIGFDADGDSLTYSLKAAPQKGTAIVGADGSWTYQPNVNTVGSDKFEVIVSDGKGGEAISEIEILVRSKPTVTDYNQSTVQPEAAKGSIQGFDLDGDKLTYEKEASPANGIVSVNEESGEWTYTPKEGFVGTDSFMVKVSDGKDGYAISTVTIIVTSPPTVEDYNASTILPEKVSGKVVGTDLDHDSLNYTKETDPKNGDVTVNEDGTWEYQPNKDFVGIDIFKVKVSDKDGYALSTVKISVSAKPSIEDYYEKTVQPKKATGKVVGSDLDHDALTYAKEIEPQNGDVTVNKDGTWEYQPNKDFVGTDIFKIKVSDKDGSATSNVTIVVTSAPTVGNYKESILQPEKAKGIIAGLDLDSDKLTYEINTEPKNGTASLNEDGTWEYQPNENFVGTDTFKVKVSDKDGYVISTISIVVTAKPTVENYFEEITQPSKAVGQVTGTDLDGDELIYKLVENTSHGTVIVNEDGTWEYKPETFFAGYDKFTVSVTDPNGNKAESIVLISVKEALPSKKYEVSLIPDPSAVIGDGKSTAIVTAIVMDNNNQVVKGAEVVLEASKGTLSTTKATTNEKGEANFKYTAPSINQIEETKAIITAKVEIPGTDEQIRKTVEITILPARVEGVVTDGRSHKEIEGAEVIITEDFDKDGTIDYKATAYTDKNGKYSILVPKGNYEYHPLIRTELVINGISVPFEFTQSVAVGDLTGQGDNFFSEKKATGSLFVFDSPSNTIEKVNEHFLNVKYTAFLASNASSKAKVTISDQGVFEITGIEKGKDYQIVVNVLAPNGERLAGKLITVTVGEDGEISINPELIDPYGIITDSVTKQPLDNVKVSLYWADTDLNRGKNRQPNTLVELPELPGFPPANNLVPQITGKDGSYAWMVFASGDYYIVAEKDGYEVFDSRKDLRDEVYNDSYIRGGVIHVEQTIVPFDFSMIKSEKENAVPTTPEKIETGDKEKESVKEIDSKKKEQVGLTLPKTGSFFDTSILYTAGIIILLTGIIINLYLRRRVKK